MYGPRSLIRTTWLRWFRTFTTRTIDPSGSVGWAAVSAYMSYVSPLAVCCPSKSPPYQLVVHSHVASGLCWVGELGLASVVVRGASAVWEGLLAFPTTVGLAEGVRISIPNPKNTDSRTTNILALIFN